MSKRPPSAAFRRGSRYRTPPDPPARQVRLLQRRASACLRAALAPRQKSLIISTAVMLALAVVAATCVTSSYAAHRDPQGSCSYANGVVSARGLQTREVVNFIVTDNTTGSQTGSVLGISGNGSWQVTVTPSTSSTMYDSVSKTWGPNGSKYTVYAECTAV